MKYYVIYFGENLERFLELLTWKIGEMNIVHQDGHFFELMYIDQQIYDILIKLARENIFIFKAEGEDLPEMLTSEVESIPQLTLK